MSLKSISLSWFFCQDYKCHQSGEAHCRGIAGFIYFQVHRAKSERVKELHVAQGRSRQWYGVVYLAHCERWSTKAEVSVQEAQPPASFRLLNLKSKSGLELTSIPFSSSLSFSLIKLLATWANPATHNSAKESIESTVVHTPSILYRFIEQQLMSGTRALWNHGKQRSPTVA